MAELLEQKRALYAALKAGELDQAEQAVLDAMTTDLHNADLEQILKIIKFWQNRRDFFTYRDGAGEKLFEEWDKFVDFCTANRLDNKKALLAVKAWVFGRIIDFLIDSYRLSPVPERETLILLGQAFYEADMVDRAIETLEYAMSIVLEDEDVRIFVMLGNLYSETGEKDLAMVMFNEAFLKYPQLINLDSVDFPAIHRLKEMVEADGFQPGEVPEWIPVYGYLFDGLTVRKRLEYKDFMDLKERIIDYEKTLKVDKKALGIIIPRLVNFYLWVLDYYLHQVHTAGPAKNVARRISELLRAVPVKDESRQKLLARSEALFRQLMENVKPDETEKGA